MEEAYQYLIDTASPNIELCADSTFDVVDLLGDSTSGKVSVSSCTLTTPESLLKYLDEDSSTRSRKPGETPSDSCDSQAPLLGRVLVADRDSTQTWKSACGSVADRFGLRLAHDYAVSCVMAMATFPTSQKTGIRTYAVVHPTLATIWGLRVEEQEMSSPTSATDMLGAPQLHAIILASPKERAEIRKILNRPWDSSLIMDPMFPVLLSGLFLSQMVNKAHNTLHQSVRLIEARTGHHNSTRLGGGDIANGSWGHLSAKMSGFARKLASTTRKIEIIHKLHEFLLLHGAREEDPSMRQLAQGDIGQAQLVKHQLELMKNRVDMHRLQNDFLIQKVNIQLTALFNLAARKDSATGLKSATSMEILALVALLFLPGNFIAALFSAPLFDLEHAGDDDTDGIGVGAKPQFRLFLAITVPLTVLAFIAYAVWFAFQSWRFQRITDEERG